MMTYLKWPPCQGWGVVSGCGVAGCACVGSVCERPGFDALDLEAHGKVDETFTSRRLRRWLKGMFGGGAAAETPPEDEQER